MRTVGTECATRKVKRPSCRDCMRGREALEEAGFRSASVQPRSSSTRRAGRREETRAVRFCHGRTERDTVSTRASCLSHVGSLASTCRAAAHGGVLPRRYSSSERGPKPIVASQRAVGGRSPETHGHPSSPGVRVDRRQINTVDGTAGCRFIEQTQEIHECSLAARSRRRSRTPPRTEVRADLLGNELRAGVGERARPSGCLPEASGAGALPLHAGA